MTDQVEASNGVQPLVGWSVVTLVWALLFSTFAVGTELLAAWSAARSDPDGGVDIGLALLLLAGWALAGVLAGGVDGWWSASARRGPSGVGLAGRWVVVGLTTGLAAAVYRSVDDGDLGVRDVAANFALSTFIVSFLVAGPAVVAAVVAQQLTTGVRRGQ